MKKEIIIKHELEVPSKTFDELKDKIANSDVSLILKPLGAILDVKRLLLNSKQELQAKVNEQLEELEQYVDQIDSYLKKDLEPRLLQYVERTGKHVTKLKANKDGEAIEVTEFKYNLPPGISYNSGRVGYQYNEDKIPEEFYKKTLDKTSAKKAWTNGELDKEAITPVKGEPSITIKPTIIKGALLKESENGSK